MGVMDVFTRRGNIPNTVTFTLSRLGEQQASSYQGDVETQVLIALQENGPSNISEICASTGLQRGRVENAIRKCLKRGKVNKIHGED